MSTRSTVLLVMVQASRSAPWKAAIEMAHVLGRPLAATLASVALDSRGYAAALPADDPLLQVSPSSLPVLYAGQMDSGPGPPGCPPLARRRPASSMSRARTMRPRPA